VDRHAELTAWDAGSGKKRFALAGHRGAVHINPARKKLSQG
jgi:hypothetical protein